MSGDLAMGANAITGTGAISPDANGTRDIGSSGSDRF